MAIIYSYPTVTPTSDDLVLGTDVNGEGKPTKNFTIQSIVDILQGGATGLGAVLAISGDALQQSATNFINVQGTGTSTFGSFTDSTMTISSGVGTGFTSITSTDFQGNLTGIIKAGSSIQGSVTGVTQTAGTSDTTLATTEFVMDKVDPSVLTFDGTSGGDQTVNLAAQKFSLLGTANEIESVGTAQTITFGFPAAGVVLPDGSTATTQAASDDSTKIATTAFVRNYDDTQDLDFSGTTGSGSVLLNSQTLAIAGTANQIVTNGGGQTLTIALTNPIVTNLTGNVTGILKATSSIEGSAGGTDAQNVLAVTQNSGDNSTRIATTAYVEAAAGAKTLDYAGDSTGPFALNLSTDDLEFNGDSNITVTAAAVAATKGIVTIDLNNDIGISGTMTAGTFTDGTFTGSSGTYTGGVSITSSTFTATNTPIGFIGNASTATALVSPGTIQLLSGSGATQGVASNAVTYTSGGDVQLTTTLANTTVTGKTLQGLPTPAAATVVAGDTILEGIGKLQSQINGIANGLQFQGTWNANIDEGGAGAAPNGTPALASGGGEATSGTTNATTVNELVDTTKNFTAAPNVVAVGDKVINQVDGQTALVTSIANAASGRLGIGANIMLTAEAYIIDKPPFITAGHYYVVDTVGATTAKNATLNGIQDWQVGDWVIASINNVWQKLNNSAVEGSGTSNRLTKWGSAASTLIDSGIIDDGTTIKLENDTELGAVSTDTIKLNGPTTFESTGRFKKGIALGTATDGSEYGASNQVLTASTSAGSPPTWETPTTGTVTSVALTETGDALTITGSPITSSGTINIAGAGAPGDYINGELNLVSFPVLDNYVSWTLAGDTGSSQTISSTNTATFAGGFGISTVASATDTLTTAIDIVGADNAIAGLTAAAPLATDTLWFNDISDSNTIRKATISNIVALGDQGLPAVLAINNTSGGTDIAVSAGDDVTFTDTSKAKFGTGNNLQIFHNGTGARIENTTGASTILSDTLSINNAADSETMAQFVHNGAVDLYHNGLSRFKTTTTGVEVVNTDANVPPTILLNQDSNNFTITQAVSGAGQIINSFGSLSLRNDGSINLQNNAGTYTKASFDSSISFSPDNLAETATVPGVTIYKSTDATADGTRTRVYGDLQVDGNIIHEGGGGGIFYGDQSVTSAGGATLAFTLTRATTGTLTFDVWFTSETSKETSVAKKYVVARGTGSSGAPVYNKIIDTGPSIYPNNNNTTDFTVSFIDDPQAALAGTSILCKITVTGTNSSGTALTQNIGYTVQVGHDSTNALTFTPAS